MEARVLPMFVGGLNFFKPINAYFFDHSKGIETISIVNAVVSPTGFTLVEGPACQDYSKVIESLNINGSNNPLCTSRV